MSNGLKAENIFLLLFFLFLGFLFYLPSPEFDFWWHLKVGELIWESKQVFIHDFLSFGETVRWVHHEWLSDVLFYFAYAAGSFYGILLLRAAVLCAACFFVFKMCAEETRNTVVSVVATLCCAYVLVPWKPGAGLRPQFFTYFFIALTQYVLFYRKKTSWLPIIFFLWANFHGGYLMGYVLLFAHGVSKWLSNDRNRFLSSVKLFALCFFAGILTPNHVHELIYPFQILFRRDLYQYNYEWFPPDIHKLYALPFFILVGVFLVGLIARREKFREGEVFFIFPYLMFSAMSLRNMPLFAMTVSPFFARQIYKVQRPDISQIQRNGFYLFIAFLVVYFSNFYKGVVPSGQRTLSPSVMAAQVPVKAVEFIKENKLPGPLFPEPDWGGYALFTLFPDYTVGVDTRFDTVYDTNYLLRVIEAFSGAPEWEKVFSETNANLILLDAIATPLKEELYASDDYKLIYYDGQSVLFMKNVPQNSKLIERFHTKELHARQFAYYYYRHGTQSMAENKFARAREMFQHGVSSAPQDARLHYLLGVALSKQKKYGAAYLSLKNAVMLSPEEPEYLYAFAYACALTGKKQEAKSAIETLLKISPGHEDAKKLLKSLDRQ